MRQFVFFECEHFAWLTRILDELDNSVGFGVPLLEVEPSRWFGNFLPHHVYRKDSQYAHEELVSPQTGGRFVELVEDEARQGSYYPSQSPSTINDDVNTPANVSGNELINSSEDGSVLPPDGDTREESADRKVCVGRTEGDDHHRGNVDEEGDVEELLSTETESKATEEHCSSAATREVDTR